MRSNRRLLAVPLLVLASCATGPGEVPTRARRLVDDAAVAGPEPFSADSAVPDAPPPVEVEDLIQSIDATRMKRDVESLAGFGTRHTLSDTSHASRGIGAARRWLESTMKESPALRVSQDPHPHEPDGRRIDAPVEIVNVVATLPGTMPEAAVRHYYVIGHYDSRASDPTDRESDAPGANDDASGVAVVLELARVLSKSRLDATVVFMATAGEEQGLLGAAAHAQEAAAAGRDIVAVLSNDIVGDPTGPGDRRDAEHVRVFSAGLGAWLSDEELDEMRRLGSASESRSRQLARYIDTVARWHGLVVQPLLVARRDRFLRGGDHTAFNRFGFPAVRFCEVWENYDHQHQDVRTEDGVAYGDLPDHVDAEYLAGVARLNAATLVHLANAPAEVADVRIVAAELTSDTTLRWSPNPEPDVAGYEVVWRRTTSFVWEHAQDVGNVTEATLDLSKDNWFFGVRAYDREGYRSPVAFAGAGKQ